MLKLIIFAALVSTFFVTVSGKEPAKSSESESCDEGDDEGNEPQTRSRARNHVAAVSEDITQKDAATGENLRVQNQGYTVDALTLPNHSLTERLKMCVVCRDHDTCPEYEVYDECPPVKCDAEYCPKSRDDSLTCPIGIVCDPPRCVCMNNRHRDRKTGKCILTQSCPPFKCDGPNEEYEPCPGDCPSEKCSDYLGNKTCGPPAGTRIGIVVPCKPQCRCKKGFYRNSDNVCVKPKDCAPKCPKNEVYSTCIQAECRALNCNQLGESISCPKLDPSKCKKGCVCAEGYVRNKKGKCIPQDTCPEGCGGDPNAKTGCSNYCGHSCSDYNKKGVFCPLFCIVNGCACKDNGDPNAEKTGCGTYCGHSCSDYNKTGVICPAVCNPDGCSCKKGYVYDPNVKKCVLPKKCTLQCTGANEEYKVCAPTCPPETCDTSNAQFKCVPPPKPGDPKCKEGCRCKSGYYRDYHNVCVKKSDCSKCTKPNQIYDSCWYNCPPDTCDSIGKSYSCPLQRVPGDPKCVGKCRCKKDYYTNSKGECISESECEKCESESGSDESGDCEDGGTKEPPKCPKNEVYSTCTQGQCGPKNCSQLGKPIACPKIDPKYCKKGCICAEGYLRDEHGKCIPKDKCRE
ncbi:Inducible metalloproteinase inhibitor protein [Eumeta japonica]|uniref:Inducible metalloproteinase inhibitor protein n=1 Tax=Eumeta variegata TaxID=151549 RepID=A0A4C1WRU3_EUMVA|nr:Inducible metalloproteinase inhibitor protein [Eumeta japonica]